MSYKFDEMQKGLCTLQLNSISSVENDPLLIKATYSILDFSMSGNKQIVSKDLAAEASPSLKGKPLLCVYTPNTSNDANNPNDHFGTHGQAKKKDRYGNEYIGTNSIAIGSALDGGYFGTIKDQDGNDIEVLQCDFFLWADRNVEVLQLMNEMHESGMPLYSSCEYYFSNYEVKDGVQIIKSPLIFSGHCILGSGENGSKVIPPAYEHSKMLAFNERLNDAIGRAINANVNINSKKEEGLMAENLLFKSLCELSHGDIRTEIMSALSKTMTADKFNYVYLSSYAIYDNYFVYENYEDSKWVCYKVPYTKSETEVSIDLGAKVLVERDSVWVEVSQMQAVQNSLTDANDKVEELTISLNTKEQDIIAKDELIGSLNSTIKTLETDKNDLTTKFNEQTDIMVSLNAKLKEFEPIVEKYNTEQYEKALNSALDFYKEKFESVNAVEEFEKEETQELVKKSINTNAEESSKAKFALNELIVLNLKSTNTQKGNEDLTPEIKVSINATIPGKTNKDLMEHEDLFEKTYGFKKQ